MASSHYIKLTFDSTPIEHQPASALPFDQFGDPRFITAPKGNKNWWKNAQLDQPSLTSTQQYDAVVYENLGASTATIRFPVIELPPPPTNQELAEELEFQELVFKAFALVTLDEVNLLRVDAGLSTRTVQQLKDAIATKMDTLQSTST